MKVQSRNVSYLLALSIAGFSIYGCTKKDLYDPNFGKENEVTLDNYFDFSTQKTIQVNISYGKNCPKAYFEIYAENPLTFQEEGSQIIKKDGLLHIAGGFTDGNGAYNYSATIPAAVSEVYIYSPDFGVPTLFKTQITDGKINADITFENQFDVTTPPKARSAQAHASISDIFKNTLGTWNAAGKPEYLDNNDKIVIDDKLKKYISTFFPENKNNTSSYVADDADILIKDDADIVINYFGGTTGAQSVFAYYCYSENASKEDIQKASQNACIIFPNAHSKALGDYSGVGVKLRYINPSGVLQSSDAAFPAGTKVGFLIWNNGWTGGNNGAFSNNVFYSTKSLNKDNISHTALFSATNKEGKAFNVITMEDWKGISNNEPDYNDVAFTITSNPREAIDLPPLPDPDENISGSNTYRGLLGYEDNWPKQGDYDMNDVVMKYISTVTYNSENMVANITDKFTLAWTGANYQNGFAYQVPFDLSEAIVTVSGGNNSSVSGNIIQLFTNAKSELGVESISALDMPSQNITEKTYTVSIQFRDRTLAQQDVLPPYNPFVKRGKTEIHLTNYAPTINADNQFPSGADISIGNGTYYICKDGYPFAIHLDARNNATMMDLNLKAEGARIDETYKGFAEWAKTRDPNYKWW